jgi:hypothetical protein
MDAVAEIGPEAAWRDDLAGSSRHLPAVALSLTPEAQIEYSVSEPEICEP